MFRVEYYPGDKDHEGVLIRRRVYSTLEEAREDARERLGDLDAWRKWPMRGKSTDVNGGDCYLAVEGYHTSQEPGCGGVMISRSEERPQGKPKLRVTR